MSEEQIYVELEINLLFVYQNTCIEHEFSGKNTLKWFC